MIKLIVNADDLGMCRAVNAGILRAFQHGIVTQASLMAVTPGFDDAVHLVHSHGIPCGVHLVLASEWDVVRWRPLTNAPSLVIEDGCFPYHVRDLYGVAQHSEVVAELKAQIDRVTASGLTPSHLDSHIMPFNDSILEHLCKHYDLKSRDPIEGDITSVISYDTLFCPTPQPEGEKVQALLNYLNSLSDGTHIIVCHPAVESQELLELCSDKLTRRRPWACELRISDLEAVTHPDVVSLVFKRGISLLTAQCLETS